MNKNTGVIEVGPQGVDYIHGATSEIQEVVRLTSGDWSTYMSPGKPQKLMGVQAPQDGFNTNGVDFLDCVSCAANDYIQAFMNWMIATGAMPAAHLAWLKSKGYLDANGLLDFSNRFTAKMSGTTVNGNSLPTVGQSIRTVGLVPDSVWPTPVAAIQANPSEYWNLYYATIPANVIALGKEFTTWFEEEYEWVFYPGSPASAATVKNALTLSPLQICTAVCAGWNTANPIQGCGAGSDHSTLLLKETNGIGTIEDHYIPYTKNIASTYDITYAMRHVITALPQVVVPTPAQTQEAVAIAQAGIKLAPQLSPVQGNYLLTVIKSLLSLFTGYTQVGVARGSTGVTMSGMTYLTSELYSLDHNDVIKGLAVAIISAVLLFVYPMLVQHQLPNLGDVGYTAAIAGVAYLIKNFFTPAQQVTGVRS